jgi:hypothetical protein
MKSVTSGAEVTLPTNRRRGAQREAERRARQRQASTNRAASPEQEVPSVDEIFARLRSGAANVAGVTYQVNLAALLLAGGRSHQGTLPLVTAIRPEGFEDIDLCLDDGSWLLVQSKQRGGERPIGVAEIAKIIVHASQVESGRDYDGNIAGFAIVTNGSFRIETTGWSTTIAGNENLLMALQEALLSAGREPDGARQLMARTRLVSTEDSLANDIESQLISAFDVPPVVAAIARTRLTAALSELSAGQRGGYVSAARHVGVSDLDALVADVQGTVDLSALEEALRSGVCELADFARGSADSEAQFFAGVRIVPGHVGSNLDVVRVPECLSILEALQTSRHVLVVGPSGTGKSGLLWRSASMLEDGPILIRVLRVETDLDVEQLVRYAKVLAPSEQRRILVCVDDIGRASTELWPTARDRLLELPGVSVLGASRQEDLLPSTSSGATLVDSRLTTQSAERIYERLVAAGLPIGAEPEEAISRAQGLLMEFVAIATTGRRLREVLRSQITALRSAENEVAMDLLGIVTALHTLGRSADANQLPASLGQTTIKVSQQLARLQDEHLLMTEDGTHWRALHDLRAEVILDLIHETPPPTVGATYAKAIEATPTSVRPALYRRAAIRVVRSLQPNARSEARAKLTLFHQALAPLDASIGDRIDVLMAAIIPSAASEIAALVDAAERLDVAAYAASTLDHVQRHTPATVDVSSYYLLAYSSKFGRVFEGNRAFQNVATLGDGLPDWDSSSRRQALSRLTDNAIAQVLVETNVDAAVRFSERLEGFRVLPRDHVIRIYQAHNTEAPAAIERADIVAQLIATLSVVSGARGAELSDLFGPTEERATWAVASDDHAFEVRTEYPMRSSLPESPSGLARQRTFSEDSFCKISARALVRGEAVVGRGYQPQPSQDATSINAQTVFLAQRILDACPEADLVAAEVVTPNLVAPTGGVKHIRPGVLPRQVSIERSVAMQVIVAELLSSERWTERCRRQAVAAAQLVELLNGLPARLADRDSTRRRDDWIARAEHVASAIAALPGLPFDPRLADALIDQYPHANDFDRNVRETMRDPSKTALDLIAGCILQVAHDLDSDSNLQGAGLRLADGPKRLHEARGDARLPDFAGVGPLLPDDLDVVVTSCARLLIARGRRLIEPEAIRTSSPAAIESRIAAITMESGRQSVAALTQHLAEHGVALQDVAVGLWADAPDPLFAIQVAGAVQIEAWQAAEHAVGEWGIVEKESIGFTTRATLVCMASGIVVQIGVNIWSATAGFSIASQPDFERVASELQRPLLRRLYQERADTLLENLVTASSNMVRRERRPSEWPADIAPPRLPNVDLQAGDPAPWEVALNAYRDLRVRVLSQTPGDTLAGAVADLALSIPTLSPLIEMVANMRLAAMEADLAASG